ncbi:MAG: hypothetical protein WCO00_13935 [Rhodospirillaceae bacterium]
MTPTATATASVTAPLAAPDPFDPASLRLTQDFATTVGVQKILNRVPVRKPGPQEFFRVHDSEDYRLETAILELKDEREVYLVAPALRSEMFAEIKPVRLYTTINRQGVVALWPCKLSPPDGRSNSWNDTALAAAKLAMSRWVKIQADMSLGGYQPFVAAGDLPDPTWPEKTFHELLKIAFTGSYIETPDHPALRRVRGEV